MEKNVRRLTISYNICISVHIVIHKKTDTNIYIYRAQLLIRVFSSTICRTWHGKTKIQNHTTAEDLGKAESETYQKQPKIVETRTSPHDIWCRSLFNRPSVTHGGHALFRHHPSIGQQHISWREFWIQLSNQYIAFQWWNTKITRYELSLSSM